MVSRTFLAVRRSELLRPLMLMRLVYIDVFSVGGQPLSLDVAAPLHHFHGREGALEESQRRTYEELYETVALKVMLPWLTSHVEQVKREMGFLIATSVNVVFAALALGVQWAMRRDAMGWNGQAFWLFTAAGGFSTYLGRWFFYESVVRFGPAKASLFQVSSPLFTALIAWPMLGEGLTLATGAGILMAIGGLVLASYKPGAWARCDSASSSAVTASAKAKVSATVSSTVIASSLTGAASASPSPEAGRFSMMDRLLQSVLLLGLGSSLAYAISNVLRGIAVRGWNEPVMGALAGAVAGLALHLAFSRGKTQLLSRLRHADPRGIWLFAVMGVCTIAAQICLIGSLRYIPVSVTAMLTVCTPVLVFPLSYWLFKDQEVITRTTLLGAALTLAGMAIIVMR